MRSLLVFGLALCLPAPAVALEPPIEPAPAAAPAPPAWRPFMGFGLGDLVRLGIDIDLSEAWRLHVGAGVNLTYIVSARIDARVNAHWVFSPDDPVTHEGADVYLLFGPVRTIAGSGLFSEDSYPPGRTPAEGWAAELGVGWRWGDDTKGLHLELLGRVDYFDAHDPSKVRMLWGRWLASPALRFGFNL